MATHDYEKLAQYYAQLGISGTYYLAFRDLVEYLRPFKGKPALDFGCGAGRSTRFLKNFGIQAHGVDRSSEMIAQARTFDPDGSYIQIPPSNLSQFGDQEFNLIFSSFVLMEISSLQEIKALLKEMARILQPNGKIIIIVSNPDIVGQNCVSFNKDYDCNRNLKSGDKLRLDITDASRTFTLYDYYWTDDDYRRAFSSAGLSIETTFKPLGKPRDGIDWKAETIIPPFNIYILVK